MEYEGEEYETGKPFTVIVTRRDGFWSSMHGKTLYVRRFDPKGKYPNLSNLYYSVIRCEENYKQFKSMDYYHAHTVIQMSDCKIAVSNNMHSLLGLQEEGAL